MKAVVVVCAVLLVGVLASFAYGESTATRPPGIDADKWISLGKGVGFVVTGDLGPEAPPGRDMHPLALQGYIVAQHSGVWRKLEYTLVPVESFRIMPSGEGP
jgi:hypothetical protein